MQADTSSKLLQNIGMGRIRKIQELRRANLASLRAEKGPVILADLTGISVALLFQMSLGKGTSARNVSDANARVIEDKCGLQEGWLDTDHSGETASVAAKVRTLPVSPWPFRTVSYARYQALTVHQKTALEKIVLTTVNAYEALETPRPNRA